MAATSPNMSCWTQGSFDNRYFDIVVEYAKGGIADVLVRVTCTNRGPKAAELHLLPTLWVRNTRSWRKDAAPRPLLGKHKKTVWTQ